MAIQLSVAVRNARLDAIETIIGTAAKLQIWSGSMPASAATASSGTKLAEFTLAADWAAAAASGSKAFIGTPSTNGIAGGTAGYFRIVDSTGATCGMQGTVGVGTGDLQVDNTSIAVSQPINITGFTMTDGNA
jgi:UDP-N-acetylmuramyl tripeptide synthase